MSIIATAVKHLLAAGVTGDALVQAIADMEANAPAAVPAGPSKGALRTRLYRERHKASQSVTCDESDVKASHGVTDPAPSPLPLLSPQTPQITPTPLPHPESITTHTRASISFIALAVIVARCEAAKAAGKRRWPKDMPPPPGVSDEQWSGFIEHRRAKRETLTVRAYQLLAGKLLKHADDEWPPGRIIDQIVERRWTSFEPQWLPREHHGNIKNGSNRQSGGARSSGVDGFTAALRQVAGSEAANPHAGDDRRSPGVEGLG